MKEAAKRHHDRKPRLAAPRVIADDAEIVISAKIVFRVATLIAMGHLGALEVLPGQLGRNGLQGCEKVGIKEPQK